MPEPSETLADIGEREAIRRICRRLPGRPDLKVPAGDDCAVVQAGPGAVDDLVLTTDPVIAGVHFTAGCDPRAVGHKAAGRVLSDLAAMGAAPRWLLINIVAPSSTAVAVVEALMAGAGELAARHGAAIAGGDLAEGPGLELHVFGIGAVPAGRACLRSTAAPGDRLYVTGCLGGSGLGRHLRFEPRIEEGVFLRDHATAMIDLSDGLASDLRHVLEQSGVGCDLELAAIPVSPDAARLADGLSPLQHALIDGEDFELLFTIPTGRASAFETAWRGRFALPVTAIGVMTAAPGHLQGRMPDGALVPWEGRAGFEHFGPPRHACRYRCP